MSGLIDAYLKANEYRWSDSTKKSEQARLKRVAPLADLPADEAYRKLSKIYRPYSLKTAWIRLSEFYDFLIEEGYRTGANHFKKWMRRNQRRFKHVYERRQPRVSFDEARRRIEKIEEGPVRRECHRLLSTGIRLSERNAVTDSGYIIGKGGKKRPYFGGQNLSSRSDDGESKVTDTQIRRALASIGLKPHDLRKIFARHLYEKGLGDVEIARVMGWESFETGRAYIRPAEDEKLREKIYG